MSGSTTKYYSAMGQTIAMRQVQAGGGQGTLLYPLHDHLGRTVGLLDGSGALVGTATYWPYGAMRSSSGVVAPVPPATVPSVTDKLYTGQRMEAGDAALELYNYNARFYSTTLGRFVSADSAGDGLNRYAYVRDNPLRYTDPTGRCFTMPDGTQLTSCSQGDALKWMGCAFGNGCDGDVQRLARGGLSQRGFWERMELLGAGTTFMDDVVEVTARAGLGGMSAIPQIGWKAIGGHYGVTANFFKATLSDLITGSSSGMGGLSGVDIIDAQPWWLPVYAFVTFLLRHTTAWRVRTLDGTNGRLVR